MDTSATHTPLILKLKMWGIFAISLVFLVAFLLLTFVYNQDYFLRTEYAEQLRTFYHETVTLHAEKRIPGTFMGPVSRIYSMTIVIYKLLPLLTQAVLLGALIDFLRWFRKEFWRPHPDQYLVKISALLIILAFGVGLASIFHGASIPYWAYDPS